MTINLAYSPQSDLGWLLENFIERVPGSESALLASRDGLKLAVAGLTADQADTTAALMSGLYSLARGVGEIKGQPSGAVRQIVVEHDDLNLFVMSGGDGLPQRPAMQVGPQQGKVGTVLGVLAGPHADPGVIGYEMATLIKSVAEHLGTNRRADTHAHHVQ